MFHWNEGRPWDLCPPWKRAPRQLRASPWQPKAGIKNWFKRGWLPLSSSVHEIKFLYYSASNVTAIKHDIKMRWCRAVVSSRPPPRAVCHHIMCIPMAMRELIVMMVVVFALSKSNSLVMLGSPAQWPRWGTWHWWPQLLLLLPRPHHRTGGD